MKSTTQQNINSLRATRCEINIQTLKNNISVFKNKIEPNCSLCLAVKANAYGHGIIEVAHYTESMVDVFAVATVAEGVALRESGITKPILVLSAHTRAEVPYVCEYNLSPFLSHTNFLDEYDSWAKHYNMTLALHIKVDTGMSRAGFNALSVLETARQIENYGNICIEGVCTHFSSSDDLECGKEATESQIDIFNTAIEKLKENGVFPKYIHAANSAAVGCYKHSHFNMVRLGISAYGYSYVGEKNIKPVMSFKTKISIVKRIAKGTSVSYGQTWTASKDTLVAILPVGYADGYKRCLSNNAAVMIGGVLCNVVGRVCMDQIMVELPDDFNDSSKNSKDYESYLGQDVILFGDDYIFNATVLAEKSGTIVYEILTSISERVPRIFVNVD